LRERGAAGEGSGEFDDRSAKSLCESSRPPQDIHARSIGYTSGMTKRLVDVDDTKLDEVRALLGTSTTKATVNGALEEVLALAARRRALLDGDAVAGSADLARDEQRRAAWA
jgi:Arc/MetJ family transcription regulator